MKLTTELVKHCIIKRQKRTILRNVFTAKQPNTANEVAVQKPLQGSELLRLTTFNCKNIRTCGPVFCELSKTEDILLIQEHWLFKCQLDLLNELNENFCVSAKAVDHYDPIPPIQIPRGYGGVAIFWKNDIDHIVNDTERGNQCIKCIELLTEKPTLIINVYMPCNGEKDNYYSFVE